MAMVCFTANLVRHVRCDSQDIPGETVAEVLEGVFVSNEVLRGYVLEDSGALRKHMNVFVNGQQISDHQKLSDAVGPDDEVYVMQALSGGQ